MDSSSGVLQLAISETDSIGSVINRLLVQAEEQERATTRYLYRESVLRYLTGAQIEINLGNSTPTLPHQLMHYWVWDEDCSAQYIVGNTMYIVTGTPGNPLLASLRRLVSLGWRPLIISRDDRIEITSDLLADAELTRDVSAMSLEMFVFSSNLRKGGKSKRSLEETLTPLIGMYNQIVKRLRAPDGLLVEPQVASNRYRVQEFE